MATVKAATRPSRPTIDTVMDNMPPYTGVIEKGGLTNDPRPTVSGRGDAGSIIHVLVDGREVGTAVVKANGTWSFALPQSLSDGEYRLTARASNDAGWSVPSTSYGIVVDVTPPSRPTIEAATEGTQPTLSGRAEAYSTVTVYDGTKVLGTATTGIDGAWTFKLPSGLSNGTHSLTVTAMDPAGNTSVGSAGFDVTIGPVAPPTPTTQAILDEMGRDSGSFDFDRLTNNGTAGRLLSGHVTAALASGEKVQVSTDDGKTWVDAVMKSDGKWVAVDSNAHTGSWTVKTRVANDDGATGPQKAYDVTLDVAAPGTPGSAVRSGNVIDVSLSGTGIVAGDAVNVMIGDHRIAYTLTAADVAAGRVKVTIPAGISATMDEHASYGVALVDISGNVSDYLVTRYVEVAGSGGGSSAGIDYKVVDFNDQKVRDFNGSAPINFGIFTAEFAKPMSVNGRVVEQGIRTGSGGGFGLGTKQIVPETGATGLLINLTGMPKFHLNNGARAHALTVDLGASVGATYERMTAYFYDDAGKLVHRQDLLTNGKTANGEIHTYQVVLPDDLLFSSFGIGYWASNGALTGVDAIWVDNIGFSGGSFAKSDWEKIVEVVPPADIQHVIDTSDAAYYGSSHGTEFQLDHVSYFSGAYTGIHGGAGIDTLKLTGANELLDLSKLIHVGGSSKLSSIEIIDITGTGDNVLKLSMRDVLELGHENLFRTDGHTQMMVKGNAGDRVELLGMSGLDDGHWANQGMVAVDGMAYVVYENTTLNVELLVQSAVSTQLV